MNDDVLIDNFGEPFAIPRKPFPGMRDFCPKNQDGSDIIMECEPVGSRITCDPAPADTDEDWLVLADGAWNLVNILNDQYGFGKGGSELVDEDWKEEYSFQSMTLGKLNLIITDNDEFYRRFLAASSVAKRFNLLDKADRIALFQAVLYGNPCKPKAS